MKNMYPVQQMILVITIIGSEQQQQMILHLEIILLTRLKSGMKQGLQIQQSMAL